MLKPVQGQAQGGKGWGKVGWNGAEHKGRLVDAVYVETRADPEEEG